MYDYKSAYRDALRPEGQLDGRTVDRFNAFVVDWNTEKVASSEIPDDIPDFADPKWDGRVALEIGDGLLPPDPGRRIRRRRHPAPPGRYGAR